jgi:hypothetical protein
MINKTLWRRSAYYQAELTIAAIVLWHQHAASDQ